MIIEDGTGKGFFGQVTSSNAVRTQGVNITAFDEATKAGEAFNINTLLQTMGAGNTAKLDCTSETVLSRFVEVTRTILPVPAPSLIFVMLIVVPFFLGDRGISAELRQIGRAHV